MRKRTSAIISGTIAATVGLAVVGTGVLADQVILDDLVVDGSLCVGLDCVEAESFGFDTIRLKENNLRIRFVDTSVSSSFPTHDWQITVNDSNDGGSNRFSIDNIDTSRTPFTIEGGAPSHSLFVGADGQVGFGTSAPATEAHLVDGNTPTVRLEQNGSQGFTPRTWDIGGNDTNFFVRDTSNGGSLPFKIQPGAPTDALVVAADGDVGVGAAPTDAEAQLQVTKSGGDARTLVVERSGGTSVVLRDPGSNNEWILETTGAGGFTLSRNDGATVTNTITITPAGEIQLNGNLSVTGDITCTGTC